MRCVGRVKVTLERSGGGGKLGVDGTGNGFDGGGARRRGVRRGSLDERSDDFLGMFDPASTLRGISIEEGIVIEGRETPRRMELWS